MGFDKGLYDSRKEAGLCTRCGEPAEPGNTMCRVHLEDRKSIHEKHSKQSYYGRRVLSLCPYCGGPRYGETQACSQCRQKRLESEQARYADANAARRAKKQEWLDAELCYECGRHPAEPERTCCRFCLIKKRVYKRYGKAVLHPLPLGDFYFLRPAELPDPPPMIETPREEWPEPNPDWSPEWVAHLDRLTERLLAGKPCFENEWDYHVAGGFEALELEEAA